MFVKAVTPSYCSGSPFSCTDSANITFYSEIALYYTMSLVPLGVKNA